MKTKKAIPGSKLTIIMILLLSIALIGSISFAGNTKILKWGAIDTLSGGAALWGKAMNQGVILAAEEINAKGGLNVGGVRYKIKVFEEDDKWTGTAAVAAATKLVYQENIKYFTGPLGSVTTLAIQTITEKNKAILMTNAFADVLGKKKPFTFRIGPSVLQGIAGCFLAAKEKYPGRVKRVAVVNANDASGWGTAKVIEAVCKTLGWKVVAKEFYERGQVTDFHPLLARVLAKKPDLIDGAGISSKESALICAQAYEMGYRGIQTGMLIMPKMQAQKGGAGVEGMIGFFGVDYEMPWITKGQKKFYERFKKRWPGQTMLFQVELAYTATIGAFKAIEKAGTLDTNKVIKVFQDLKWNAPAGVAQWVPYDSYGYKGIKRQIGMPHPITELRKGKLQLIKMVDLGKIVKKMGIKLEGM